MAWFLILASIWISVAAILSAVACGQFMERKAISEAQGCLILSLVGQLTAMLLFFSAGMIMRGM